MMMMIIIIVTKFVLEVEGAVLDSPIGVVEAVMPTFRAANDDGSGFTHSQKTGSEKEKTPFCAKAQTHLRKCASIIQISDLILHLRDV